MPRERTGVRESGKLLEGTPYRLLRRIGVGTMGEVFEAEHEELGLRRAVKVLAPHLTADAGMAARMRGEARVLGLIRHPNLVEALDVGVAEGRFYFAMPLLEGVTLRSEMSHGPIEWRRAVGIALGVLAGLEAAHRLGFVHRDVKPENVFLCSDGLVKVLDFGIAKSAAADAVTQSGFALGTPRYMPPEQFEAKPLDGRADLYATAVMLYEMIACKPPFGATEVLALAQAHLSTPAPRLERDALGNPLPEELTRAIARAMEKVPAKRQRSAASFATELAALDGVGSGAIDSSVTSGVRAAEDEAREATEMLPVSSVEEPPAPSFVSATPEPLPAVPSSPPARPYRLAREGRVIVVAWDSLPEAESLRTLMGEIVYASDALEKKVVLMVAVPANASVPDEASRVALGEFGLRANAYVEDVHFVVEGEGFRRAVQHSVLTSIKLTAWRRASISVHRKWDEAMNALATKGGVDERRLRAAIDELVGRPRPHLSWCTWRDVFVLVDDGQALPSEYAALEHYVVAAARRYPNGMGGVVIVPSTARPPSEEGRNAMSAAMQKLGPSLRCLCWVTEGGGFQGAMARAVLTGVKALGRVPYPCHVTGELGEAVRWVLHQLDGGDRRAAMVDGAVRSITASRRR